MLLTRSEHTEDVRKPRLQILNVKGWAVILERIHGKLRGEEATVEPSCSEVENLEFSQRALTLQMYQLRVEAPMQRRQPPSCSLASM